MGTRENEFQISQNYTLHKKLSEFYLCFHNSCEIQHSVSQASMRNFLWCYYRWLITSLSLEKCKKEDNFVWIILVQGFCPLKIKLTQFPDGFRLNFLWYNFCTIPYIYYESKRVCVHQLTECMGLYVNITPVWIALIGFYLEKVTANFSSSYRPPPVANQYIKFTVTSDYLGRWTTYTCIIWTK